MAWLRYFFPEPDAEMREALVGWLSLHPFEAFQELPDGLSAFIREAEEEQEAIRETIALSRYSGNFSREALPEQNWNAVWESNFQPITIGGRLGIRAGFHAAMGTEYELLIEPKMSFGTGHHPTTAMVAEMLLENPPKGLSVLDVGSGTGILSILARMLGASHVLGVDNDPWCEENFEENVELNEIDNVHSILGTISEVPAESFGMVIANINRNVLLEIMPQLSDRCAGNGELIISGFYDSDKEILTEAASAQGFKLLQSKEQLKWTALRFKKNQ
jgi:ribosomal protein L11 methyltransferase